MTSAPTASRSEGLDATPQHTLLAAGSSISDDSAALRYMGARLCRYANHMGDMLVPAVPNTVFLREPDARLHRVVLMSTSDLRPGTELTFVGFFGQKRPGINSRTLDQLDQELISEFRDYPHLLSYSSLELADGNWGNLVVMTSPQGIVSWATSACHARAAQEVAPGCYLTIRLHRGMFTIRDGHDPLVHIQATKHFDFTQQAAA